MWIEAAKESSINARFYIFNIFNTKFNMFIEGCLGGGRGGEGILFRSWVINNNVKNECVETRPFFILANNSRSKQNKKNPEHTLVEIGKQEMCAKFQQKILKSMVVGVVKVFNFSDKKTWFLEINRALSKFLCGVLHYLISIIKS